MGISSPRSIALSARDRLSGVSPRRGPLVACAALAFALPGCPAPRTFEIRVFDGAKSVVTRSSTALRGRVEGATATWRCADPATTAKPAFERKNDGLLVATLYDDVPAACAVEVSAPGYEPQSLAVGAHCDDVRGAECKGFRIALVMTKTGVPDVAAAPPSAIPLDAPRGATSGDIQTVFSVVLRADGTVAVDGKDLRADDEVGPLARTARERGGAEVRAVIKADAAVPHGRVIHVLDLLKQANLGKIAFGVQPVPPVPGR